MAKSIVTPKNLRDFANILQQNIEEFTLIENSMNEKLNMYDWQDAVAMKFKADFETTKEPLNKLRLQMEEFMPYLTGKADILEEGYTGESSFGGALSNADMKMAGGIGVAGIGGIGIAEIAISFYGRTARESDVSDHSKKIITDILKTSQNPSATITSTIRTPEDQARIMFNNIRKNGKDKEKKLYGKSGQTVIDIVSDEDATKKLSNKEKGEIIKKMTAGIKKIGPNNVSNHAAPSSRLYNVIDIAPSSIDNKDAFIKAVQDAKKKGLINRFFMPPKDDAYHIEILQPKPKRIMKSI